MKIGDQVFRAVLDTGATLSIVARRLLKTFKKTKTMAIRVGDGRTIHSLGGVDVTICLGNETVTQHCRVLDTDAFDIVIGTDFLRRNPQVKMCNSSTLKSIDPKRHARLNHKLQSKYPSFRMQVQDSKVAKLKLS